VRAFIDLKPAVQVALIVYSCIGSMEDLRSVKHEVFGVGMFGLMQVLYRYVLLLLCHKRTGPRGFCCGVPTSLACIACIPHATLVVYLQAPPFKGHYAI
jgi:hypothetical protein